MRTEDDTGGTRLVRMQEGLPRISTKYSEARQGVNRGTVLPYSFGCVWGGGGFSRGSSGVVMCH